MAYYSFSSEVRDVLRYAQGIGLRIGLTSDEPGFWRAVVVALLRNSPGLVATTLTGQLHAAYVRSEMQHAYVLGALLDDDNWAVYGVDRMQRILQRSQVAKLAGSRLLDNTIAMLQLWGLVLLHSDQFRGELQVEQAVVSDIKDLCRWPSQLIWPDTTGFGRTQLPAVPPIKYRRRLY